MTRIDRSEHPAIDSGRIDGLLTAIENGRYGFGEELGRGAWIHLAGERGDGRFPRHASSGLGGS